MLRRSIPLRLCNDLRSILVTWVTDIQVDLAPAHADPAAGATWQYSCRPKRKSPHKYAMTTRLRSSVVQSQCIGSKQWTTRPARTAIHSRCVRAENHSWSFQGGPRTSTCAFPERPAGALALALALPLPEDLPHESAIVVITFDLVAFSLFRYG